MSDEVEFGDIQVSQPELGTRPDHDPQYAVVAVGQPVDQELPIFVAYETLRAIEQHVGEDLSIELGGVLLGGQYVDQQGQPFVVVREALSARHYEATKGSFKFTMDTWQDLLQRTGKYPAGTKMIGWYHSHPGWGIFLSEMDLFICEGFFNNPLDVALVVDPCQDHRGWFHWQVRQGTKIKQRNAGFYLFDSRHRLPIMQRVGQLLDQAESPMNRSQSNQLSGRSFPRVFSSDASEGGQPPAQVFISQPDTTWPMMGLMAMLGIQTLFIGLLAWSILSPPTPAVNPDVTAYQQVITGLIETIDSENTPAVSRQRLEKMLSRQHEIQTLKSQNQLLTLAAEAAQKQGLNLADQLASNSTELQQVKALNRDLEARVATLEASQTTIESGGRIAPESLPSNTTETATTWWWSPYLGNGAFGLLGLALGGIIGGWWFSRRSGESDFDPADAKSQFGPDHAEMD